METMKPFVGEMNHKFGLWSPLLVLLLLKSMYEVGAREMHMHQMIQSGQDGGHYHMDHMSHIDPANLVFFMPEDLKVGKVMTVYFRDINFTASPHFLPKEEADLIPFSSEKLAFLLDLFSFSKGSSQAQAVEQTLKECEIKPIRGEIKFCATSYESMLDFAQGILGSTYHFNVLSTKYLSKLHTTLENYTILHVLTKISTPKKVVCHTMPYPYTIFYCHYQDSGSKVFKVSLRSESGGRVEAIAICHMDTSQWSLNHVSFSILGLTPGSSPICHFLPSDNLVWFPSD